MKYATEDIARTLREARQHKALSQRALSALAGVPQSHISKIEAGTVDLRLSSLIELARALDLELTLVPRNTVPAVQSIMRATAPGPSSDPSTMRKAQHELARFRKALEHLPANLPSRDQIEHIRRLSRELQHFPKLTEAELQTVRQAYQELNTFLKQPENQRAVQEALKSLQQLRNHLVHHKSAEPEPPRPAYTLDEEDNG